MNGGRQQLPRRCLATGWHAPVSSDEGHQISDISGLTSVELEVAGPLCQREQGQGATGRSRPTHVVPVGHSERQLSAEPVIQRFGNAPTLRRRIQ